ncbi:hypothetical protein C8F01DRAFT_1083345 [Mycena amicta]|nr:hypothetical protein C8F01DRAFT_1083345 [Mycena amicta]
MSDPLLPVKPRQRSSLPLVYEYDLPFRAIVGYVVNDAACVMRLCDAPSVGFMTISSAPTELVAPAIMKYWKQRKTDSQILEALKTRHIDLAQYGLGLTSFIKIREEMGLLQTRKQAHSIESIREAMVRLRVQYPKAGQKEISDLLFHEESMSVPRIYEPELVLQRRANRLKRKRFWAAGVNDMCNPRLILKYYLDVVEQLGYMPLVSQSDPGVENFGLANGHTLLLCHMHDGSLVDTLQHRWMNEKKNVMPEVAWSQLCRRFTPGFEDILDFGVNEGWYSPKNLLKSLVFRFVFIPWLQAELDVYVERLNNSKKRADRNKILPHGVPNNIFEHPEDYGALNFKVKVRKEAIDEVRSIYAPPSHEVFQLVPPDFYVLAMQFYAEISNPPPPVTRTSVWDVYLAILGRFEHMDTLYQTPTALDERWGYALTLARDDHHDDMELLPNLHNLPEGSQVGAIYLGGVNNGLGLDSVQSAQLDDMMNRDLPLPLGTLDIVEVEVPVAEFSSDEEFEEEQVEALLTEALCVGIRRAAWVNMRQK